MTRITNALLDQRAFGKNSSQPMLDLTFGGQMGYAPVLTEWVSNQAYVRQQLIAVLLEAPKFMNYMPDTSKWIDTLKAIVEVHPKSIEGLNAGITLEFEEQAVGGAGEMQQEVTDSKRARSEPVFAYVDKHGMPIQNFLYQWITYGIMDPDTKFALSNTLTGTKPSDMLADMYTCSILFIEPDPQHKKVVKSWIGVNMMPKTTGEITGKRDLTAAKEMSALSIEWTGIFQFNLGTNVFAQTILDGINMNNANPFTRPAVIQSVSSDVAASSTGYKAGVETLGSSAIKGITG